VGPNFSSAQCALVWVQWHFCFVVVHYSVVCVAYIGICVCFVQPGETEGNIAGRIADDGALTERGQQVRLC